MKIVKKWRANLQTVEFPNHEKYSDNEIMKIIYKDVPERLSLLKWIALKISDDDPSKLNMSNEDVGQFFCERGLLSKRLEKDFIKARCSEKLQEETWKILFSFTRMHKFLNPPKSDYVGVKDKFPELLKSSYEERFLGREPSVTIEEIDSEIADSDLDRIVETEVREIKKEMEKRKSTTDSDSDVTESEMFEFNVKEAIQIPSPSSTVTVEKFQTMANNIKRIKELKPFTLFDNKISAQSVSQAEDQQTNDHFPEKSNMPLFSPPRSLEDIKLIGNESERKENMSENYLLSSELQKKEKKIPKKEWFKENEVIPRLFVMPGSPPLGNLNPDKIKIVCEDSAPPITLDGSPYHNHSQWEYRVYEFKKRPLNPLSFEEFMAADRNSHVGVGDEFK